jgi:hypothetical protein
VRSCEASARISGRSVNAVTIELRQIEKVEFVGDFWFLVAWKIEQLRQDVVCRVCRSFRVDQILTFILQLHLRARGVDVQADSGLLQVRRLIVKTLGKSDLRFRVIVNGKRAKNKDVLGYDRRGDIFARNILLCVCFTHAFAGDLIAAK